MSSRCSAVIAPSIPTLIKALQSQGFFLVASLPGRIEVRGSMFVVRFP